MPFVSLPHSPLSGGPTRIHYREHGTGAPLIFLHSGWGYEIFSIHRVLHALGHYRVIIPDRSGYGRSSHTAVMTPDFHRRAAEETFLFLDALGIQQAILWGHSDGSVIAARMALMAPQRCRGLILEAFHYHRCKIVSQEFFRDMVSAPEKFGERAARVLAHEHGEPYWRELLQAEGRTWLDIAAKPADSGTEDLFDGRFGELACPTAIIQGAADPRTDPGELAEAQRALPEASIRMIELGEHCPHSESKAADAFTHQLMQQLARISGEAPA